MRKFWVRSSLTIRSRKWPGGFSPTPWPLGRPLGLFAEEIDPGSGAQLGNSPRH